MLNEHLIAKTSPIALKENVVSWLDYRITVLSERLFRIEKSPNLKFRDSATQSVWFRNAEKQTFSVNQTNAELVIKTKSITLKILPERQDCTIILDGKELPICNDQNLKGTYRTLDRCDGDLYISPQTNELYNVELSNGVCSLSGVAVHDDSSSLSLSSNGEILPEKADGTDEYVFAFGSDYLSAIKALYAITGKTPLVPRFALGNWWSRYHDYSDEEYLRLINRYQERGVPLTVATVDMDWHWSKTIEKVKKIVEQGKATEYYGFNPKDVRPVKLGWTGYSWNTDLFPDYKAFLKELKDKGLKVTLNLHPACGVRYYEDLYEQMALAMGVDPKTEKQIEFDIANTNFVNNYFSILHKPYEKDGVAFWWIDWQQGVNSKLEGLDPLWALNHYHYLDNAKDSSTPLILSRYGGVGSHRYPLGFSGDTYITWKTLKYLTYFTPTASNVGYGWWSHDIGGHYNGIKNHELFVRHMQFGVFSPINRLHGSNAKTLTKEPIAYKNGTGLIVDEWLKFRHKLIPILYTASENNYSNGIPLIQPLYYKWRQPQAYEYQNEYLFAEQLIVAPVTEPKNKDGYSKTQAWLPKGKWTDIFTGDEYVAGNNGKKVNLFRTLDSIPVLIKEGGILPLSNDLGNSVDNPKALEVWAFNGNGEYTLFEDGSTKNITAEFRTTFVSKHEKSNGVVTQSLTVKGVGNSIVIPENRTITIKFKNAKINGAISVTENGKKLSLKKLYTDVPTVTFTFNPTSTYVITVTFKVETALEKAKERAVNVLLQAEGTSEGLELLCNEILATENISDYKKVVKKGKVSTTLKRKLLETL